MSKQDYDEGYRNGYADCLAYVDELLKKAGDEVSKKQRRVAE